MTSAQIKSAAEKAGWQIEVSDHRSDPDVKFIGIHPGKHVWYWWRVTTMFYTGNEICSFDHAYSQNTGKTKKGYWTAKYPIEKRIEKILNQ